MQESSKDRRAAQALRLTSTEISQQSGIGTYTSARFSSVRQIAQKQGVEISIPPHFDAQATQQRDNGQHCRPHRRKPWMYMYSECAKAGTIQDNVTKGTSISLIEQAETGFDVWCSSTTRYPSNCLRGNSISHAQAKPSAPPTFHSFPSTYFFPVKLALI